jgi:hypothetical protein
MGNKNAVQMEVAEGVETTEDGRNKEQLRIENEELMKNMNLDNMFKEFADTAKQTEVKKEVVTPLPTPEVVAQALPAPEVVAQALPVPVKKQPLHRAKPAVTVV